MELESLPAGAHPSSVLFGGYLWLQPLGGASPQLWKVDGSEPEQIPLPQGIAQIEPLAGVQLTVPGQAAIAVYQDDGRRELVSIDGITFTTIESWLSPRSSRISGPPSLLEQGNRLVRRAAGLPLELIDVSESVSPPQSRATAFLAIESQGAATVTEATLEESYVIEGTQPNPTLTISRDGQQSSLSVAPSATTLLPLDQGVLVISTEPLSQCEQSERDCSGYQPNVTVVDTRGAAEIVATLPFPELPLPRVQSPSRIEVRWGEFEESKALRLGDGRWVFVATADLVCQTEEDCTALGIYAVPIAEAGVVQGTRVVCPPDVAQCDTTAEPPAPSVYGRARHEYFYVLNLGNSEAEPPSWQLAGKSVLESSSSFPARNSRFAEPGVSGQQLFSTRLERLDANGQELERGLSRVMLDRFIVEGPDSTTLPPVNVPGRPLARLEVPNSSAESEWLSLEPQPGEQGLNTLHRLELNEQGAQVVASFELEPSLGQDNSLFGVQRLDVEALTSSVNDNSQQLAVILASANACAASRLQLFRVSSERTPLELSAELELPSDDWQLLQLEANRALLRRDRSFALVGIDSEGQLALLSIQSTNAYIENPKLVGDTLRAAGNRAGAIRLEFFSE